MDPDHADQFVGRLVERGKGHRAGIIELGQAGDEFVGKRLHRREKPQPQVLHRDVFQHRVDQRLILGPERTNEHAPAVLDLDVTLPLRGIRPHGEIRRARTAKLPFHAPDHDARVDGEHACFIGQQRIDVELADFGNVGCHL